MRQILLAILALCSIISNAQNQVVRRHGKTADSKEIKTINTSNKTKNKYTRKKIPYKTFNVNGVSFEMVKVEAGSFMMGVKSDYRKDLTCSAEPLHKVTITRNYYIGKTEVTQALWKAVMGNNPSYRKGDNLPVEQVSWDDCQEFINKLNKLIGTNFRLPTEAEWEFAARGGNKSRHFKYSGSQNIRDVGWYEGNSEKTTHEVATKQPNELGIYDMSGNVAEWCSDWYAKYGNITQVDPKGPSNGYSRVKRGGDIYSYAPWCPSTYRHCASQDCRSEIGLRLSLSE